MILDGKALADASLQDEMLETERARKQQEAMSQFTQMARQAAQEQAAQQAAQDPLNAIQRQIAYNLVGAKQAYKDALANGDTEGMAAAHGAADSFRNQGNAIGWNGDGYGQGVTLEQAAQNLANNDARALANIFYNQQNADDHYTMEIANLLDKGYSIDSAKRMAAQSADRLDRRNNAELLDSFATYGLDPRGVLTNNGVRILGELAQNGNSELANFYANMYAKPVQNWGWQNQLIAADNANRYATDRMEKGFAQQDKARHEGYAQQAFMAQLNNKLGIDKMLAQAQLGQVTREAAYNFGLNKLIEAGVPEDYARQLMAMQVAGIKTGGSGKGNSNGGKSGEGGMKISDANTIVNQYRKWAEEHPDSDPSANPFKDGYDEAVAAMNGYSEAPLDPNNADSVYSWATRICEENYRRGYPLNEAQLMEVISKAGGYGPQVAEQLKQEGMLAGNGGYGRKE